MNMRSLLHHLLFAAFIAWCPTAKSLRSQPLFPPNFPVFDSATVARIDITIHPDTLQWIYENVESDIQWRAAFAFNNGAISDTFPEIGFQLGGNTSRYSQKKSFNLDFNQFQPGQKFHGLGKLNLNGEHNDPSVIRSRVCWEWLRAFGVPAPRAAHAMVYINGNCYGLYMMVEQIDDEFVDSRFGNDDGNLFKCLWPADLAYLGANPNLYKFEVSGRRVYSLRTNKPADDYTDFAHFIDILNNTPANQLYCKLEEVFNVQDYLKVIAMDVITGNWDGYIYNKNNFYLYHNTATGKFEYIPYDLDNTIGIDWINRDWGKRDIYDWAQHGNEVRPLYNRLMEVPEIRDQYTFYVKKLLDLIDNEDSLFSHIDQVRAMISPFILDDPYYPLDYGYTFANFLNSYNQALGGHVAYGLKPFIQTRKEYARMQLEQTGMKPVIKYIDSKKPVAGEEYWVHAFVQDEDPAPVVTLYYRINWGLTQFAAMYDDGNHHDREAGDGIYGCVLPPLQFHETLSWQVNAKDNTNQASLFPCLPTVISFNPSAAPKLFINEIMAANQSTIADEFGEYDDWVEIYNGDESPVWLGDKYLTDNLSRPDKWSLPGITVQPGEFVLIWADDQQGQGIMHANFKLDKDGERLAIFDNENTGYFLIDSVSWGLQQDDMSFGRQADGGMPWVSFEVPTPGYGNASSGIPGDSENPRYTIGYPNPVTGDRIHFRKDFTGCLTDIHGRVVWSGENVSSLNTSTLPRGIYILKAVRGPAEKVILR